MTTVKLELVPSETEKLPTIEELPRFTVFRYGGDFIGWRVGGGFISLTSGLIQIELNQTIVPDEILGTGRWDSVAFVITPPERKPITLADVKPGQVFDLRSSGMRGADGIALRTHDGWYSLEGPFREWSSNSLLPVSRIFGTLKVTIQEAP